jgi:hypothetical protein
LVVMKPIVLFLLLLPVGLFAQTTISGKVINAADKKPVGYATVFLSNTMVGTRTAEDGSFILQNAKSGLYDMVISFVGFQTYHQSITLNGEAVSLPVIELVPKLNQLKEVKIGLDVNRENNLAVFKRAFLGQSDAAEDCRILNPEALNFDYDAPNKTLNANTDDFLVIENKALGYKIRYQVNKFVKDNARGFTYYEGPAFFEEIQGKPSQQRSWIKKRLEVYRGSDMHFLRSAFAGQVEQEGFKVMRLIRKPNPARPADSLIRAKLKAFGTITSVPHAQDSLQYWNDKFYMPKEVEYLVTKPLTINEYTRPTDNKNMMALLYSDYLYVFYTKKHTEVQRGIYHPLNMPDYPTTVITLNAKYALFDNNGIMVNPSATTYDGAWTLGAVAQMLPVDYTP